MTATRRISVRALVEFTLRGGDLRLEFTSPSRAVDAVRAHREIQNSRPETYTREVSVSHVVEADGFNLEIAGRIDGVFNQDDQTIIEEIKTTTRPLDEVAQLENLMFWGQAKAYAYIYAAQNGLDEIEVQLTFYRMETGEMRETRRVFTLAGLEEFFNRMVGAYLEWARQNAERLRIRDDSIGGLEFPYPAYRPGQRNLAVEVYLAVKNKARLIAEAPTGLGKTMAVVFPAIKALGRGLANRIFFLTARTTGGHAAENALEELRGQGLSLTSVTLTAKDKICFSPGSTCTPEECPFARGHYDRLPEAMAEAGVKAALTREAVEEIARGHRVCPFEFSLDLALEADLVIGDYNYVFDPQVGLKRMFMAETGGYVFLIDEAHNLADRARDMYSAGIDGRKLMDLAETAARDAPGLSASLEKVIAWLDEAARRCREAGKELAEKDKPTDLEAMLLVLCRNLERWLAANTVAPLREALLDLYFHVLDFLRIAGIYNENYAVCHQVVDGCLFVRLFCLDPSAFLNAIMQKCGASIFFSATLSPAKYYRDILGCDSSVRALSLPAVFPGRNFRLLVAGRISTRLAQRERTGDAVAGAVTAMVRARPGNYLVFLPSYRYLAAIHARFTARAPEIGTMVQTPAMPEDARWDFLRCFSADNNDTLVGFAVMGGIFGEGIDLVGDRLVGVAVIGVGLPGISPERELIRAHYAAQNRKGYEYAYLLPGMTRVRQAAGRVIRSEKDRGVVLLIDDRFATARYRSLFPQDWRPVPVRDESRIGEVLAMFWDLGVDQRDI